MNKKKREIEVRVDEGDALKYRVDTLAVKYAQKYHGLDGEIVRRFEEAGFDSESLKPLPGQYEIVSSHGQMMSTNILFYGVPPLRKFRYQQIREFSRGVMQALLEIDSSAVHLGLTLHGANYGLDEVEAFEAEIAGLADAVAEYKVPEKLELITLIERNAVRAKRLAKTLNELLPLGRIIADSGYGSGDEEKYGARLRSAGYASDSKPHVFVAMPFNESMDDVYHYGISGAVRAAGFVCERVDERAFTGDVLARVKQRIKSSSLVVADLSTANSNVYLEVGYAWGCGIPTILVVSDVNELKFDVQGQRCLEYKKIKDLERMLLEELSAIGASLGN
ncbi:MAG: hypothetical protein V7752_14845 [Halopseudomonas sp.]